MKNHDYISIGIPFYNTEEYLEHAIASVINQTHQNWELILIDDGSTDGSLDIANRYEALDSRIRVISDGKNMKLPYRLNQIIDESNYDLIARMDADDAIHPNRLSIQLKFLENHPDIDIVSTGLISIDNDNIVYGYRYPETIFHNITKVQHRYPITHATILARKSWYIRNRYDTNYPRSEDYALWCKAATKKDLHVATLPDLLYYYREAGNIDATKMINSYIDHYNVFSKYTTEYRLPSYLKMLIKKQIIKILDKTGSLQRLALKRNQQKIDKDVINQHQQVIDKLIKSIN